MLIHAISKKNNLDFYIDPFSGYIKKTNSIFFLDNFNINSKIASDHFIFNSNIKIYLKKC